LYSQSLPRTRAITDRSGGGAPNHAFASAGRIAVVITSPIFASPRIRLSRIWSSVRPRSVSRL
jgi:hypothetical protein